MTTIQTWGYKPDGSAQIFDLKEGEKLPDGWSGHPEPWNHPNSKHLHPRPVERESEVSWPPDSEALAEAVDEVQSKKRGPGRPRSSEY